jgi:predicted RNA-binding protein YlxR (DUF448 family)
VRVVLGSDGAVTVGRSLPGRGAWLCAGSLDCCEQAVRRRALARAFRREVRPEAAAAFLGDWGSGTQGTKVCEDR